MLRKHWQEGAFIGRLSCPGYLSLPKRRHSCASPARALPFGAELPDMSFLEQPLPAELQVLTQPQLKALEAFVRSCLLAIGRSPGLARRLNVSSTLLQEAFVEYFNNNRARPPTAEQQMHSPPLQLVFRHDCLNLGCLDTDCNLCKENPHRRCDGNFSNKYLAGDVLKAKCGAAIRIELVNRATAESVPMLEGMDEIRLEMCILDGKEYASLQDGRNQIEAEVSRCNLLVNNQQKELLVAQRGGVSLPNKYVALSVQRGQAYLPELMVTGSSEALLSGQKPPFRLFVGARSVHDGSPVELINFVVSEPFVVATPRVRTAAKANIPHVDDHVKVLSGLGNQTQQKLLNIPEAAAAVGVSNLAIPHTSVSKVGQFRDLIREADRDRMLCDTLKKVLKLTKGWDAAREHALSAVNTDNRMRIWYKDDSMLTGLLFRCTLGNVDLENPVGLLTNKGVVGDHATLEATLVSQLQAPEREQLRKLQGEASSAWWQQGHPGWAIWPVDSDAFQKAANSQVEALVREAKEVSGVEGFEGSVLGISSGVRVPAGTTYGGIATSVPKGKKPRPVGPDGQGGMQQPPSPGMEGLQGMQQPVMPEQLQQQLGHKRPAEGDPGLEGHLPKMPRGPDDVDSEGTVDEDLGR